jgi:CRISPR-associated exonuclease Cas4
MLSGIQHIAFCERQFALAYIEMQWIENILTIEGHHLHENVDNPFETDKRGNTVTLRAVPLISYALGLYGRADVVELILSEDKYSSNAIEISGRPGKWTVIPVEYKRGKPKPDERDEIQLCAQAMCLEEMYKVHIDKGIIYYGSTHHRIGVEFTGELRASVISCANRMHEMFNAGITPLPAYKSHCRSCSLFDICLPVPFSKLKSVSEYLKQIISAESGD